MRARLVRQSKGWMDRAWNTCNEHIPVQAVVHIYIGVFLVGVALSALLTPDRKWWHAYFSVLGGGHAFSSHIFNLTLITSGLLLGIVGSYAERELPPQNNRKFGGIEICFWLMGLGLAVAGIVPYDHSYTLHYLAANVTALAFAVLAIRLRAFATLISRSFIVFNYAVLLATAAMYAILYGTHIITMTVMEIVIGALFLVWLERFVSEVIKLKAATQRTETITDVVPEAVVVK